MATLKVSPILLAGTVAIASGLGMLATTAPAYAAEDVRVTSIEELKDVDGSHWAYDALKNLVEKYDVVEGYPSKRFLGNRFATRYEMAAALNDVMRAMGNDLARLGAEKANRADLEALSRLQDEFANELALLKARTDALESRADAIEAKNDEQDNRLTLLEKTQLHGDMSVGVMGLMANNPNNGGQQGPQDALQAIARLRLTLDVPVKDNEEGSLLGEGRVRTRLIAAIGNNDNGNGSGTPGFSGLSRIAADQSVFNEGFGQLASNTNNRANVYVERMVYEQDLNPGIPLLTDLYLDKMTGNDGDENWQARGTVFAGVIPFRDYFDKSKFRGDELNQFQNTAFVNLPGLPTNATLIGFGYAMEQNLGERAKLGLTMATGSPNQNDLLQLWSTQYEAKLSYSLPLWDDLYGAFYAGGIHTFDNGGTPVAPPMLQRNGNPYAGPLSTSGASHTIYGGLDQEIWNGIGFNVGYTYANARQNSLLLNAFNPVNASGFANTQGLGLGSGGFIGAVPRQALSAVVHIPTDSIIPNFRTGDHFGVGYSFIDFQEPTGIDIGSADAFEQVMETYYTFYLNDQISFVPSFQLVQNRLGINSNDVSMAVGFRTNVRF
jgi:hypothetical protein